jgi:hypothetical protein
MRFTLLMIPKDYGTTKPGTTPDPESIAVMTKFNHSLADAGVLVALNGLHPLSEGARITKVGSETRVDDAPVDHGDHVVGGFWILDVKSKAEAIEWARKIPRVADFMIEVRQVMGE